MNKYHNFICNILVSLARGVILQVQVQVQVQAVHSKRLRTWDVRGVYVLRPCVSLRVQRCRVTAKTSAAWSRRSRLQGVRHALLGRGRRVRRLQQRDLCLRGGDQQPRTETGARPSGAAYRVDLGILPARNAAVRWQ